MRAVSILTVVCVAASLSIAWCADAPKSPDRAYVDAVLDALVDQGILTQPQVEAIKAKGEAAAKAAVAAKPVEAPKKKAWTDTLKISGYTQGRWTYYPDDLTVKDANAENKRIGNEFSLRRARLTFEAKPTATTKVSSQIDFAKGELSVIDAYIEEAFGLDTSSRLRLGQQYVPFGFENPQSTAGLIPLEQNWVTSRTIPGSRDTGLTYFYTTPEDRKLFEAGKSKYYAPGDYGNFALSVFNGQGIGKEAMEVNSQKHISISARKPFVFGKHGQYAEVGASYYTGDYYSKAAKREFDDSLLGIHVFLAPQPWGLQAEYFNGETEGHDLDGWYGMGLWRPAPDGTAFLRYDELNGWRKGNNKADDRHRWSVGYAWDMSEASRLTVEYDRDVLDTTTGGDADVFGVQWLVKY